MAWSAEQKAANRAVNVARLSAIKVTAGCVDCGYNKHPAALQLDHVDGEKRANVSDMMNMSWDLIQDEIAKCEVRCANCHAIITVERRSRIAP